MPVVGRVRHDFATKMYAFKEDAANACGTDSHPALISLISEDHTVTAAGHCQPTFRYAKVKYLLLSGFPIPDPMTPVFIRGDAFVLAWH